MPQFNFDLPEFYQRYVNAVEQDDLIPALITSGNETLELIRSVQETSGAYAYAEDKWTIKEVIAHMIDAERVFAYRALWFARNDKTDLPGFNENDWAVESNANSRRLYKIAEEYANVRAATVDLFSSFSENMLKRVGTANGLQMSAELLGFIIVGHETHHRKVLLERYLSN
ncbi:DinB family protein [Fulvivirga sp. RKSG066]|uniref:DinB family protein n=1 Tax=Fulvivirga aurantia TaxID=2529383 RepID=UPI0012BB4BAB|nr:DinB family protein [Fulvivirga aurantia]MTI21222.1 DinB family protein [Fulvivirga aurantia]